MYSRLLFNIVNVNEGRFFDFSLSCCLFLNLNDSGTSKLSSTKYLKLDINLLPFKRKFALPHISQAFPSIDNL